MQRVRRVSKGKFMFDRLRVAMHEYQDIRRKTRAYAMVEDGGVRPSFAEDAPEWTRRHSMMRTLGVDTQR